MSDIRGVFFSSLLVGISQFKRTIKSVFCVIHNELIIAHTTVGLAQCHILVEFTTALVSNDNLDGEFSGTHANGHDLYLLIQGHFHFSETLAHIINILTEDGGLGKKSLA